LSSREAQIQSVTNLEPFEVAYVELDVKDSCFTSCDQFRMKRKLLGQLLYTSRLFQHENFKFHLNGMMDAKLNVIQYGIVTKNTSVFFRSLRSRVSIMVPLFML